MANKNTEPSKTYIFSTYFAINKSTLFFYDMKKKLKNEENCLNNTFIFLQIVRASSNDHLMTSRQIEKDLLRTIPGHICFNNKRATGVPRMRRILRGLAWLYPDIGYCQVCSDGSNAPNLGFRVFPGFLPSSIELKGRLIETHLNSVDLSISETSKFLALGAQCTCNKKNSLNQD